MQDDYIKYEILFIIMLIQNVCARVIRIDNDFTWNRKLYVDFFIMLQDLMPACVAISIYAVDGTAWKELFGIG